MTTRDDVPNLFHFDESTNRIVAYVRQVGVAHQLDQGTSAVSILGAPLDPETKQPTDFVLIVQMQPAAAWALAQTILAIAEKYGWEFPPRAMVEAHIHSNRPN